MRIEVRLQRVRVGALEGRLPARRSSTPNPQGTSLGARDTYAGPMLVEESDALLTQLFARRILLTDGGEEIHGERVRQEVRNRTNSPCKRPEVDAIKGKKAFPSCR